MYIEFIKVLKNDGKVEKRLEERHAFECSNYTLTTSKESATGIIDNYFALSNLKECNAKILLNNINKEKTLIEFNTNEFEGFVSNFEGKTISRF